MKEKILGKRISTFRIIILGFIGVILLGTCVLMLPAASVSGKGAPFGDALFTAVSAVCVTGLIVRDTATSWSGFGQAAILLMIQIGGLGVITAAASIALLSGRKLSLMQRSLLQNSMSAPQVGGIVRMTGFIFRMAFLIEGAGAVLLMPLFIKQFGLPGIWMAVFHSVSAFCNAGFDVMGSRTGAYSSLTAFSDSLPAVLIICALIIIGGIGFLTWDDISDKKWHLKKYRMQSKVILSVTAVLILVPGLIFFFRDFAAIPLKERFCLSLFQAVTPRTAGFNTANLNAMTGTGRAITIFLMLTGGAPGSTAGGMKVTTLAVILANSAAVFRRRKSAQLFGRRIENAIIRNAATLFVLYIALASCGALFISAIENLPVDVCLFETASAIGTVGLSLGITPGLGMVSRIILMFMMFLGRVGGLTLIYAALSGNISETSRPPVEKIAVG